MKILTVRLSDEAAQYIADCAAASRLSQNKTVDTILLAARDSGWREISMVPTVRQPNNSELSAISDRYAASS